MSSLSVDLVVCTKDRDHMLLNCIPNYTSKLPCNRVIVVNSTAHPDVGLLSKLKGVYWVFTPDAKLGYARNIALKTCNSDYVIMLDDDLNIDDSWYKNLIREFEDPKVVAVNSKIVYGSGFIEKIFLLGKRKAGGSAGCAIYDRKAILKLGGFNDNIHRGEDIELHLRIEKNGMKWIRNHNVKAFHPTTLKMFLARPKANVCGWKFIMQETDSKLRFIAERFMSIWLMPIYYFWRTLDPRVFGVYLYYKLASMLYWLSGRYDD